VAGDGQEGEALCRVCGIKPFQHGTPNFKQHNYICKFSKQGELPQNSELLIRISLQPNVTGLGYFKQ